MTKYCQLQLTCANKKEADKIANTLLVKHLITCAKQIPIASDFKWQGKIEHADEVLLLMDSKAELFEQIESEVANLHSYDTFVLQAIPITSVSGEAAKWMQKELRKEGKSNE